MMKKVCKKSGHEFFGELAEDASFCPYDGSELVSSNTPTVVDLYVHGDGYDKGQELGMTGDALEEFARCLYEVKITVRVDLFDGKTTIIAVDDVPLSRTLI